MVLLPRERKFIELLLSGKTVLYAGSSNAEDTLDLHLFSSEPTNPIELNSDIISLLQHTKHNFSDYFRIFIELFLKEVYDRRLSQEQCWAILFIYFCLSQSGLDNSEIEQSVIHAKKALRAITKTIIKDDSLLCSPVTLNKQYRDNKLEFIRQCNQAYCANIIVFPYQVPKPEGQLFKVTLLLNFYLDIANHSFFRQENIIEKITKVNLQFFDDRPSIQTIKQIAEQSLITETTTFFVSGRGYPIEGLSFLIHHFTRKDLMCFPYQPNFVEEWGELQDLFKKCLNKTLSHTVIRNVVLTPTQFTISLELDEFESISKYCHSRISFFSELYSQGTLSKEKAFFLKSIYYSLLNITIEVYPDTKKEEDSWNNAVLEYQKMFLEGEVYFKDVFIALKNQFPRAFSSRMSHIDLKNCYLWIESQYPEKLNYSIQTIEDSIDIALSLRKELSRSIMIRTFSHRATKKDYPQKNNSKKTNDLTESSNKQNVE